jgi:formamidopyrimidine-DNA glycosylase
MPELPEVETVRRGLAPVMVGSRIERVEQRRPDLRFPFPEDFVGRLEGRTVTGLSRRAKYLLADLSSGEVLVMHLGMSGRFTVAAAGAPVSPGMFHNSQAHVLAHDHVVFHLSGGARITYNDTRRFGFMDLVAQGDLANSRHVRDLGLEPLSDALSGESLARLFAGRRAPLKAALLDQSLVAGLGNIYVCEALHRAGLHPQAAAAIIATPAGRPRDAAHRLAAEIRAVLQEAVEAGGSTLRDHAQVDGSLGYFQHRFRVYDRGGEPCPTPDCTGTIERLVQAGRSTFFCPTCQKRGIRARGGKGI